MAGLLEDVGVLILAGGQSIRFGAKDKLELTLNGRDLTQIALDKYCGKFEDVVVSSSNPMITKNCDQEVIPHFPAAESKGLSIFVALEYFERIGLKRILLAEAARPFTIEDHVDQILGLLDTGSNAVVSGYPSWETVYHNSPEKLRVLPRHDMYIGQTPEGWDIAALKFAVQTSLYQTIDVSYSFAAVLDATDFTVDFCQGTRSNIKITYDIDEIIAVTLAKEYPELLTWGKSWLGE